MQSNKEKLANHDNILVPVLDKLKTVILKIFNEKGDMAELSMAIEKLNEVRQHINNIENIGLVVGINEWLLVTFPLSGDPSKDADGLHPLNQGLLVRGEGKIRPCTPLGAILLIDLAYSNVAAGSTAKLSDIKLANLAGKRAIVIGRSILVGKPAATLLLERNATVTVAHSKTGDIASICREADIVIAAVGIPEFVQGSWIKEGAVVIDVGINRSESGKLVGDANYREAAIRAGAITPVPGGVGPMTVAMLMRNTWQAYQN